MTSRNGQRTACQFSGVCSTQAFDVTPYAYALANYLLRHNDTQDFGRKFKIASPAVGAARSRVSRLRRPGPGPSKVVVIGLMGGMDDLYSVAPKERSEVKKGILPVFASTELTSQGSLRLAPGWACLAPYQARMQVITGIQCNTVSHHTGVHQTYQMRRNLASNHERRFITNAGEALARNALLHSIHIHAAASVLGVGPQSAGRGFVDDSGGQILAQLHQIANDETLYGTARHALAAAIESSCVGSSCESFRMTDSLLEKLHGTAAPVLPPRRAYRPRGVAIVCGGRSHTS